MTPLVKRRFMSFSSHQTFLSGPPQPLVVVRPQPDVDAFELYCRLAPADRPSFLLESANGTDATARYSFFGRDPYLTLTGRAQEYQIETGGQIQRYQGSGIQCPPAGARRIDHYQDRTASRRFMVAPSDTSATTSFVHSNHSRPWPPTISISLNCTWPFSMSWPRSITIRDNCT